MKVKSAKAKSAKAKAEKLTKPAGGAASGRLGLGLVSIAILAGTYVYFSDYLRESSRFQVRSVQVEGVHFLDEASVFEASGITGLDNVFAFDPESAKTQIEKLPYVKSCAVSVSFPDTVVLTIEERQPVATLLIHSRAYEIDGAGVVLREFGPGEHPREPLISAVGALEFVAPGDRVDVPAVSNALSVWGAFRETGLDREVRVSEFSALSPDDIRMYCDDFRYEVRWGRGAHERQALRLAAFWQEVGMIGPCKEYLDLRFGKDLACK